MSRSPRCFECDLDSARRTLTDRVFKRKRSPSAYYLNLDLRSSELGQIAQWPIPFCSAECRKRWWEKNEPHATLLLRRHLKGDEKALGLFVQHAAGTHYVDVEGWLFEDARDLFAWWEGDPEAIAVRCVRVPELRLLERPPQHWTIGQRQDSQTAIDRSASLSTSVNKPHA